MGYGVPFLLAAYLAMGTALLSAQKVAPDTGATGNTPSVKLQQLSNLPLAFERRGASEFRARGEGYAVNVLGARTTVEFPNSRPVSMEFVQGRQTAALPEQELPGKVNYMLGNDPRRWGSASPFTNE
jgi:hypothetical protein